MNATGFSTLLAIGLSLHLPAQGASRRGHLTGDSCLEDSLRVVQKLVASPQVRAFLRRDVFPEPALDQVGLSAGGAARVVAALSWGGPSDGTLVVLDCRAHVLHVAQVGYVFRLKAVAVPGGEGLYVRHQTGLGTGWQQRSVTIYRLTADSLAPLWTGVVSEYSYELPTTGAYEIEASARVLAGGRTVLREGRTYPVAYDKAEKKWRRVVGKAQSFHEAYSWDPASDRFVRSH